MDRPSGIVIGQGAEFDYSGTQAARALKEEEYRVILVNSNPATIMTDPEFADRTYIEPITPEWVEKIIERERPDALLPTMGGQTALNVAMALARDGVLGRHGVELIGANERAIRIAEDRQEFAQAMRRIGLATPLGFTVTSVGEGLRAVEQTGYPAILRPSYTLGGTGGGVAWDRREFEAKLQRGLELSPVGSVLVERSILGWKEFELEVMRDGADNVVIVCSIENLDPMGVHTGDSITVAPAMTLTDREYQVMRDAACRIIREVGVEAGGCNVQFAVNPADGEQLVQEQNVGIQVRRHGESAVARLDGFLERERARGDELPVGRAQRGRGVCGRGGLDRATKQRSCRHDRLRCGVHALHRHLHASEEVRPPQHAGHVRVVDVQQRIADVEDHGALSRGEGPDLRLQPQELRRGGGERFQNLDRGHSRLGGELGFFPEVSMAGIGAEDHADPCPPCPHQAPEGRFSRFEELGAGLLGPAGIVGRTGPVEEHAEGRTEEDPFARHRLELRVGQIEAVLDARDSGGDGVIGPDASVGVGCHRFSHPTRLFDRGLDLLAGIEASSGTRSRSGDAAGDVELDPVGARLQVDPRHPAHFVGAVGADRGDAVAVRRRDRPAGDGDERAAGTDPSNYVPNVLPTLDVAVTASGFDASAALTLAFLVAAAAAQGVRTPVLWVIGSSDRPAIQDQAPYTVGQRVVVDANHQTTPVQGVAQTVAWIKAN